MGAHCDCGWRLARDWPETGCRRASTAGQWQSVRAAEPLLPDNNEAHRPCVAHTEPQQASGER